MTSTPYDYSQKLKTEFEPVLRFFEVKPTGNLFKDLTLLAEAIEGAKIDEKLTKFFFDFYDRDGNGTISRDELSVLVRDIGEAMGDESMKNITDEQLDDAMAILDEDGSGEIEWNEFKNWFDELMQNDEEESKFVILKLTISQHSLTLVLSF
ncbi:hypothetical protein FDP41_009641 [Naegleria fowleri]|uniref:EF-hand domain-containing protein n=1 Tax=Naegleria fowleri TaxID=5763 RepID=A0A6A5BCT0_NAEFO|nr:uncharacterized protein FDP41_009641 [Naegleria fowleri]KAF0971945.1 hypothetical protein FDP41_009641 [Naegleria fowleri]